MQVITVATTKGGTGKSTISQCLACGLERKKGTKVVILDADPQVSSQDWYQLRAAEGPFVVKVGAGNLDKVIKYARKDGFTHVVIDTSPSQTILAVDVMRKSDLTIFVSNVQNRVLLATRHFRNEYLEAGKPNAMCIMNLTRSASDTKINDARNYMNAQFPEMPMTDIVIRNYAIHDDLAAEGKTVMDVKFPPSAKTHHKAQSDISALVEAVFFYTSTVGLNEQNLIKETK